MRLAWFALLALALSLVQHGRLVLDPAAPDLPLALAAWGMVDGDEDGVLPRAWIAGFCRDLVDPGSVCFHTVAYTALALGFLPLRAWVFRGRALGWALWAGVCALVLAMLDARLGGVGVAWRTCWAMAVMTGVAAIALGWVFASLPATVSPVGKGGA